MFGRHFLVLIAILNWQVEINIPELNPEMVRDFFIVTLRIFVGFNNIL